jgi:hypothetical protein
MENRIIQVPLSAGPDNMDLFYSMTKRQPVAFLVKKERLPSLALPEFRFGVVINSLEIGPDNDGHAFIFEAVLNTGRGRHVVKGYFCTKPKDITRLQHGYAEISPEVYDHLLQCTSWLGVTAMEQ